MGRDTTLLFYDVTNFYFEIGDPDPDEEDENGEIIEKGSRKKGVSKEHKTSRSYRWRCSLTIQGSRLRSTCSREYPGSSDSGSDL